MRVTSRVLLETTLDPLDWRVRLVAAAEFAGGGHPPGGAMAFAPAGHKLKGSDDQRDAIEPAAPFSPDMRPTRRGGLLMLVNLLGALGFPRWLDRQQPGVQASFGRALLRSLGRLPTDDPHHAILALSPARRGALAAAWCDAGDFQLPAWCPVALAPGRVRASEAVRAWRGVAHAACRALGLAAPAIVRRDASLSLSLTHADVILPLGQADVRLRRAGLDQDPGWTPWLGYIVSFHFAGEAG